MEMHNVLMKLLGAFLTSFALGGALLKGGSASIGWFVGLLTVGLTLLFLPTIKK